MVPELTDDQRREYAARATEARRMRHSIKAALKAGALDPVRALSMEGAARMRVRDFLRALPGVGDAKADRAMRRIGISPSKRVQGLGCRQMEKLIDWIEDREH